MKMMTLNVRGIGHPSRKLALCKLVEVHKLDFFDVIGEHGEGFHIYS